MGLIFLENSPRMSDHTRPYVVQARSRLFKLFSSLHEHRDSWIATRVARRQLAKRVEKRQVDYVSRQAQYTDAPLSGKNFRNLLPLLIMVTPFFCKGYTLLITWENSDVQKCVIFDGKVSKIVVKVIRVGGRLRGERKSTKWLPGLPILVSVHFNTLLIIN